MPEEQQENGKPWAHPGGGPLITKQSMKKDVDLKLIIDRYRKTGTLPYVPPKPPVYGDFSSAMTLQEAMDLTRQATAEFMKLPAAIRAAARNNPAMYLEMLADEGGRAVLEKVGLKLEQTKPSAPAPLTPTTENPVT